MESLKPGEAHVWYLWPDRVTDSARLSSHAEILSDDERLQNQSFRFQEHRHAHLLTRAFLRTLLSRYADVKPSEWQFVRSPYGKPEIAGPPGAPVANFSLSHTAGLIVCAISAESRMGIDAENVEQRSVDQMEIAEKYFSRTEYQSLQGLSGAERHRRFFEYWTLKESYVKARGLGMSLDLAGFAFEIEDRGIRISFVAPSTDDPAAWQFQLFSPGAQHIAAVSIACGAGVKAKFEERDGTPLMH
jgi:4'-phosphopantetheinyl transferase